MNAPTAAAPVVIVGAGLAGSTCARRLYEAGVPFTIIDPEVGRTVELPPLSKSLFAEQLGSVLLPHPWPDTHDVHGHVTAIDPVARTVEVETEAARGHAQSLAYGRLVLATGMAARTYPGDLPGGPARVLRTPADASAIRSDLAALAQEWPDDDVCLSIGVLGSGFLALELARGAADAGYHPTVYLRGGRPVPALSEVTGRALMDLHASAGVTFVPDADPEDYAAHDLWMVSVGAEARTDMAPDEWARAASGALEVDAWLRVPGAADDVFAIGDAARVVEGPMSAHGRLEAEAMAMSQGEWLGEQLVREWAGGGNDPAADDPWLDVPWHWSFQGPVRVFSVGKPAALCGGEPVVLGEVASGKFQVVPFDNDAEDAPVVGVETIGAPPLHNAAKKVMAAGASGGKLPTRADVRAEGFAFKSWLRR